MISRNAVNGEGTEVRGPVAALLQLISGRTHVLHNLTGPGPINLPTHR